MRIAYYRGDIVLADVVFSGGLGSKPRPVVILSTGVYHQGGIKIVGAAITSNLGGPARLGDVILADWQAAGLAFESAVRGIVITVDRVDVRRVFGIMSAQDLSHVEQAIKTIMGF